MRRIGKILLWLLIGRLSSSVVGLVIYLPLSLIGLDFGTQIESFRDILFLIVLIGVPMVTGLILGITDAPYRKLWSLPLGLAAIATAVFLLVDLIIAIVTGIDLASALAIAFMIGLVGAPGCYITIYVIDG